jgi:hypothetical protein
MFDGRLPPHPTLSGPPVSNSTQWNLPPEITNHPTAAMILADGVELIEHLPGSRNWLGLHAHTSMPRATSAHW